MLSEDLWQGDPRQPAGRREFGARARRNLGFMWVACLRTAAADDAIKPTSAIFAVGNGYTVVFPRLRMDPVSPG